MVVDRRVRKEVANWKSRLGCMPQPPQLPRGRSDHSGPCTTLSRPTSPIRRGLACEAHPGLSTGSHHYYSHHAAQAEWRNRARPTGCRLCQGTRSSNSAHPGLTETTFQAFQELNRGEQTATALENHLAALEAKIDELLAATGQQDQSETSSTQPNGTTHNSNTQSNS